MTENVSNPSFIQKLRFIMLSCRSAIAIVRKGGFSANRCQKMIDNPDLVYESLVHLLTFHEEKKSHFNFVRSLSSADKIILGATDGQANVYDSREVFKSFVDDDFKWWKLNQPGLAAPKTSLRVGEVIGNVSLKRIFLGLWSDIDRLVMTQNQIVRFCQEHPQWLRANGYSTYFLTKLGAEYFVVRVNSRSDGLCAFVFRLEDENVRSGDNLNRVVFPWPAYSALNAN